MADQGQETLKISFGTGGYKLIPNDSEADTRNIALNEVPQLLLNWAFQTQTELSRPLSQFLVENIDLPAVASKSMDLTREQVIELLANSLIKIIRPLYRFNQYHSRFNNYNKSQQRLIIFEIIEDQLLEAGIPRDLMFEALAIISEENSLQADQAEYQHAAQFDKAIFAVTTLSFEKEIFNCRLGVAKTQLELEAILSLLQDNDFEFYGIEMPAQGNDTLKVLSRNKSVLNVDDLEGFLDSLEDLGLKIDGNKTLEALLSDLKESPDQKTPATPAEAPQPRERPQVRLEPN